MEFTFSTLRQKEVINLLDGKRLGKVSDIVITYPENNVIGLIVPSCQGFRFFSRMETVIEMRYVKKIGDDAILVELKTETESKKKCPQPTLPPPCPICPPPFPPPCPPDCPPKNCCNNLNPCEQARRSLEEYE